MLNNCICYQLITGNCKICNHGISHHSKVHYIYEQYEEEIYENDKNKVINYEEKEKIKIFGKREKRWGKLYIYDK